MSGNRRPAKVRVFSAGEQPDHPLRRHDDIRPDAETPEIAGVERENSDPSAAGGMRWGAMLLFLAGCAIGGALISFFGFFEMSAS